MKKFKKRLVALRKNIRAAKSVLLETQKTRENAVAALHHLNDEIVKAHDEHREVKEKLEAEQASPTPNSARIADLEKKLAWLSKRSDELNARVESRQVEKQQASARAHRLVNRIKWYTKRKTTLRKKIKKAKAAQGPPKYESWMANGYNDYVTQGVKDFVARAVVNYDCYVTSLRRTYVPPGGSTTSYHLQSPGRAGDIGGSRMTEFQISEYNRNKGNSGCLELYGPSNVHNLRYGQHLTQAEGSANENLHDTHVHGAF